MEKPTSYQHAVDSGWHCINVKEGMAMLEKYDAKGEWHTVFLPV